MILNALRCALGILSGNIIFKFATPENLRIFRSCFFTGGVAEENGSCCAGFLRKHSHGWKAPSALYDPFREKALQENPQIFLKCNIKLSFL
jgi:hypothetical protein